MQGDNISQAIDAINKNEVVGIPTETVYGIGVNPNSKEAVEKLFELKERDDSTQKIRLRERRWYLVKTKVRTDRRWIECFFAFNAVTEDEI